MKIEFLLLPEYGEQRLQSEQKNEQIPLYFPLLPRGCAAGFGHDLHWILFAVFWNLQGYLLGCNALGCCPGGTLPSWHAGGYYHCTREIFFSISDAGGHLPCS